MQFQSDKRSFATQLILFMTVFLAVIYVLSYFVTRHFVGKVMLESAYRDVSSLALEKVQLIEKDLSRIETQAQNLQFLVENTMLGTAELENYIQHLFQKNEQLRSLCLANTPEPGKKPRIYQSSISGMIIGVLEGYDYLYKDWYQIPHLTQKANWSEPWFDAYGTGNVLVSYSLPYSRNGVPQGVIRLDMPLQKLQKIAQEIRVYDTGYALLLTQNGTIVAHPADSLLMNYTIFDVAEELDLPHLRFIGQQMSANQTGFQKMAANEMDPTHWIYYLPLRSNSWTMGIVIADNEVFADMHRLLLIYFLSSVGAILVLIFIIYWRTRAIYKSLNPLVEALERIGEGDFDTPLPPRPKMYEIKLLTTAFDRMLAAMKEHVQSIQNVTDEKNKILSEVIFASEIQRKLTPRNSEQSVPSDQISTYGIMEPAGAIGGDLYDYFMIDADHFCFAIADVVGKGIVAAMTMTMVTTYLRSIAHIYIDPANILSEINEFLVENKLEYNFVTILLGIIDLPKGTLSFSNAGHVPLYIICETGELLKYAETHTTALGFLANLQIRSETLRLHPGDEIILVTDGVTEAMNSQEDFFGTQRLESALQDVKEPNPEATAEAILSAVREFAGPENQSDDLTILTIDYMKDRT